MEGRARARCQPLLLIAHNGWLSLPVLSCPVLSAGTATTSSNEGNHSPVQSSPVTSQPASQPASYHRGRVPSTWNHPYLPFKPDLAIYAIYVRYTPTVSGSVVVEAQDYKWVLLTDEKKRKEKKRKARARSKPFGAEVGTFGSVCGHGIPRTGWTGWISLGHAALSR
ncbi:uncharacterized protein RAG0_10305 [Rhynchosporium agropyri]|uniref:Uncharacterized protein n=1 Tax=Rhynchosporium agropyri TaxID=914238 RepID=A0A1E1KZA7_9HELO|nr:uncharacterized protein RAG0_10305 [Rhynchosporium agropyri]